MSSDIAISVKNLTKTYRIFGHPGDRIKQALSFGRMRFHKEFTALKDISFEIKKGETVGIIGCNGSGKSTLLQLICGILKPTSGTVEVNGRISALLELGAGFNSEFTGRENVYFQGAVMGLTKSEVDARFDDIAAFADIGEFMDQPVRTYSSGMYVRLAFANMINTDSEILVIDEALAVGDEAFQRKCFNKLADYLESRERVLFFVSHNIQQIERVCARSIWLEDGQVVRQGATIDICNAYQGKIHQQIQAAHEPRRLQPDIANAGELDVIRVQLFQDRHDEPVEAIQIHTPVTVVIDFLCHEHLIAPEIVVGFHTMGINIIAAASTALLPEGRDFRPGTHRVECRILDMALLPGVYQVRLAFFDRYRRAIWIGHHVHTLRVTPSPEMNLMRMPSGFIDMPFRWSFPSDEEN